MTVLSYLIPVRSDATRLRACLDSIRAFTGEIPSEVVVGDNGSTDDSAEVAREAGARVLDLPNRRVAEVRNSAAQVATGEFLAFIDADHVLDRGWAEAAMRALADPTVSAVGAQYHAPPGGTWVQRIYDHFRQHEAGDRPVQWLPSGNLVIRRPIFEKVGGFDTSLETCEDVDLCQRIVRNGGRLLAVERMHSVHHGDPATLRALFFGELWRGRDNLRVSLRVPLTLRSLPSIAAPVLTLAALIALPLGILTSPLGGWRLVAVAAAWLAVLTVARAVVLVLHAPSLERSPIDVVRSWLVAAAFEAARALALVARSGHDVRRRTSAART